MKKIIIFILIFSVVILLLYFSETIGILGIIGLMFLMIIISATWSANESAKVRKEKENKLKDELKALDGFSPTKKIVSPWGLIAIDDNSQQIAIRETLGKIKKYPYTSILSCEVLEDGVTTYRKSSIIGRSLIGGIIAGRTGAIIGGLSGQEKESKEIKNLDFKIVIKDTNNPSFKIRFFDAWEETNRTKKVIQVTDFAYGPIFEKAADRLKSWKDTIEVIIDKIDSETKHTPVQSNSISDELIKLNELKEKGVLTEEEFLKQKMRILE